MDSTPGHHPWRARAPRWENETANARCSPRPLAIGHSYSPGLEPARWCPGDPPVQIAAATLARIPGMPRATFVRHFSKG